MPRKPPIAPYLTVSPAEEVIAFSIAVFARETGRSLADDKRLLHCELDFAGGLVMLSDAFWGSRFSMVHDPFGHRWLLNALLPGKDPA